jgi:hypothetical protein
MFHLNKFRVLLSESRCVGVGARKCDEQNSANRGFSLDASFTQSLLEEGFQNGFQKLGRRCQERLCKYEVQY